VKIEALAQLGQMLMSMKKHEGGNPVPKENRVDTHDEPLTLAELKIDKKRLWWRNITPFNLRVNSSQKDS